MTTKQPPPPVLAQLGKMEEAWWFEIGILDIIWGTRWPIFFAVHRFAAFLRFFRIREVWPFSIFSTFPRCFFAVRIPTLLSNPTVCIYVYLGQKNRSILKIQSNSAAEHFVILWQIGAEKKTAVTRNNVKYVELGARRGGHLPNHSLYLSLPLTFSQMHQLASQRVKEEICTWQDGDAIASGLRYACGSRWCRTGRSPSHPSSGAWPAAGGRRNWGEVWAINYKKAKNNKKGGEQRQLPAQKYGPLKTYSPWKVNMTYIWHVFRPISRLNISSISANRLFELFQIQVPKSSTNFFISKISTRIFVSHFFRLDLWIFFKIIFWFSFPIQSEFVHKTMLTSLYYTIFNLNE